MVKRRCLEFSLSTLVVLPALAGCVSTEADRAPPKTTNAHLLALSTRSASLGTPIDGVLENPIPESAEAVDFVFDGTFARAGGGEEHVALVQRGERVDPRTIRWTTFGPFGNPFTPSNPDIGVFRGKVGVRVTLADGAVTMDDSPVPIELEVQPSIIVADLQPTTATCDQPALRLIGQMSYKMRTLALGFTPTRIEYAFKTPEIVQDSGGNSVFALDAEGVPNYRTTTVAHDVAAPVDTVDGSEALALPAVPPDRAKYGVVFSIVAHDNAGRTIQSTFGMTVHKPLEIYNDPRFSLAQIYPAEPVSSCLDGGKEGRVVSYSEGNTATRQRTSTLSLSTSWLKSDENTWSTADGKTVATSQSGMDAFARSHGTSNTFSFEPRGSTTTDISFKWQDSTAGGSSGEVTIPITPRLLSVQGDKSSESGWNIGGGDATTDETTSSRSTATTDWRSIEKTDTTGGTPPASADPRQAENWTVTSARTIDEFHGSIVAGTSGVFYRQLARYTRKAFVLEYTKCGESEVIGDVTLQDYVWAPDLALGTECRPLPRTNLPQPACRLSPCME